MSRINSINTKPEKVVRSLLHAMGFRFRIHQKGLPGKPDLVLKQYNTVIFVNGCFWHGHKNCTRGNIPKSNKTYWVEKIKRNVLRDKRNIRGLRKDGWRVIVVWECKTKNIEKLKRTLPAKIKTD